jgi:hypothetical protein
MSVYYHDRHAWPLSALGAWHLPVAGWAGLLAAALSLAGCRPADPLVVTYGQRRGEAVESINGTSVLAGMFQAAGCKVHSWRRLTAGLSDYDVVVWAPDDYGLPTDEVQAFFEAWLTSADSKTLVYVGRDYDAEPHYWNAVLSSAPAGQKLELMRRRAQSLAEHDADRLQMPARAICEWFTMERDHPPEPVRQLSGPWCMEVDAARTGIYRRGLLRIPAPAVLQARREEIGTADDPLPRYESLLQDGDTPLVFRVTRASWGPGQIIVVNNGSFLLNLPLVNHEHRKLAGQLIRACPSGGKVAFLESQRHDALLAPASAPPAPSEGARQRVLLVAHWLILGLAYCFYVFPIFGRPRSLPDPDPAEFVQHIDALGELLENTQDKAFAQRQLDHYQALARRDASTGSRMGWPSGASHAQVPRQSPTHDKLDAES